MPWDPVLKLDLHFFVFAGPMNSAHGPTKKTQLHLNAQKTAIQTHTKSMD